MLKALYNFRKNNEKGFTLIELLIVVAIIAILAAIAIPQFSSYRKRGYNAAANSDLRNIRTTEEAIMADFQEYGASSNANNAYGVAGTEQGPGGALWIVGGKTSSTSQQVSLSPNVYVGIKTDTNASGTARTAYTAVTTHASGDNYYGADSSTTTLFRMGWSGTYAAGNTLAATPASTTNDDYTGVSNWIAMQ